MTSKKISFETSYNIPKPFLKWAGGKSQLLDQFSKFYPTDFRNYYEPFVGSGAVYFHLYGLKHKGGLGDSMGIAYLSDSNKELINCYRIIKDQIESLLESLFEHKKKHSKGYYYEVRAQDPNKLNDVNRAARFIYLNKTCFNGLYRVNSQGQFNVPMGKYKNPAITDVRTLVTDSIALQYAELSVGNYVSVLDSARAGDFVYFDPPYHPLNSTSNFTSYTEVEFGKQQQKDLADTFRELNRRGCKVMLSNSASNFISELYSGFRINDSLAGRLINSNAGKRNKIYELVIRNY